MSDNYFPAPQQQMMNPVDAVKSCFSKYFDFSGRAQRSEFWFWLLFTNIISWIISFSGGPNTAEIIEKGYSFAEICAQHSGYMFANAIVSLVLLIPTLAVWSRRLHDIGCSAWWLLLWFTCVGILALYIMAMMPSQQYSNRYGSVPGTSGNDDSGFYNNF